MSGIQKLIKIGAICFAIFLIVNICGWIIFGITMAVGIGQIGSVSSREEVTELEYYEGNISQNISEIDIDIKSAVLDIEAAGEEFIIQIDDKSNFTVQEEHGKLKIKETSTWFWNNERTENIKIIVPENVKLKELDVDAGGGKLRINGINAEEFNLDQGAGVLRIENSSFDKTDIDGGAGEIRIESSVLNDLKLDAGVGKVDINGDITGNSTIECGIGQIDMTLTGNKDDYKITAEKGIGSIRIDGTEQGNSVTYGNGKKSIKVERWNWKRKCKFLLK